MTRIIAIANQKGGVGKTTTAVNLATALAATGKRVTLVDFDPQGNASTGFGVPLQERSVSSYDILKTPDVVKGAVRTTMVPKLSLIASTQELASAEVELVRDRAPAGRLREALRQLEGEEYIFIDSPPSLGLLTLNALLAADSVLVPLQVEFYALEGLSQLMKTIEEVRRTRNADLELEGVVLTMFDRRNRLSEQVAADVRAALGAKVFETVIPRNVRLSEAPSHGVPALLYDLGCSGSRAYMDLARELIGRKGGKAGRTVATPTEA